MAMIEEYIVQHLNKPLKVRNKETGRFEEVTDPEDGHVLTKEEGIALNIVNSALQSDIKSVEHINRAKIIAAQNQKKKK